jgi:hypothetical protein
MIHLQSGRFAAQLFAEHCLAVGIFVAVDIPVVGMPAVDVLVDIVVVLGIGHAVDLPLDTGGVEAGAGVLWYWPPSLRLCDEILRVSVYAGTTIWKRQSEVVGRRIKFPRTGR